MTEGSRYLSFMGMRIHFQVAEPEDRARYRLMLLSSPLMNAFHWRKVLPELSGMDCLSVVVDLPGFGLSESNLPWDEELTAKLVWGVLDAVDAADEAPMSMWHLCAHGAASRAVLKMAAMFPDSVKSQVHLSPLLSAPVDGRRGIDPARWYDDNVRDAARFQRMIEHYAAFPMDGFIVDRMRRPLLSADVRGAMSHYLRRISTPPREGCGFCPTMVIYGGRDPLLDDARTRQMHQLLHGAEFHRLSNAGHFPTETHSRAIRDYLRGWLRFNE